MARPYDIITFDCYGTLIDWDAGIAAAFRRAADRRGAALDSDIGAPGRDKRALRPAPLPEAARAAYARHEPAVQAEAYRSYREVLAEAARRTASELGWDLPPDEAALFAESLPGWTPFADTNPALERLAAAGYRLGVLSNVDPDLFAETRRHFTVGFDPVITAADVRSYKPAPGHFTAAQTRVGGARWLHAAQSHFHDVAPARALGIPTAWVNRHGEPLPAGGPEPSLTVRTLAELADALTRGA
jgi:2-haloalkanoic acid dehalogenase type II